MDQQPQEETQPTSPKPVLSHSAWEKYAYLKWPTIVGIFLLVGIPIAVYAFSLQQTTQTQQPEEQAAVSEPTQPPPPTPIEEAAPETLPEKGYPIPRWIEGTKTRKLSIYSFLTKKLKETGIILDSGGGGVGFGDADPVVSPDLKYTAYVDNETNNLWLLTNDTLEKQKITTKGGQILISGWSPDSQKLVYFIYEGSFQGGMIADKTGLGFFLYDRETNRTKEMPIEYFVSFIDSQRILIKLYEKNTNRFFVFDIDTLRIDEDLVKDSFDNYDQFDFTNDGKHWTYSYAHNGSASVIYAEFPSKDGEIIAQGGFADVQWPKISSRGSKIAYIKKANDSKNFAREVVWVYDTEKKTNKRFVDGQPEIWVNENILIFSTFDGSGGIGGASKYHYIDINTGKTIKMN